MQNHKKILHFSKPLSFEYKINYQVMGANEWRSAPSIDKMSNSFLTLYLTDNKSGEFYTASPNKPSKKNYLSQEVDFSDRQTSNNDYYPAPIVRKELDTSNGFLFVSEPITEPIIMNGSFWGQIKASINKKDMDFGVTLYEIMPNGEYFHLSYFVGRASYAHDITKRKLLTPNTVETLGCISKCRIKQRVLGRF